jgi:peptide methionine sulfoxide reductase msrA/msrB
MKQIVLIGIIIIIAAAALLYFNHSKDKPNSPTPMPKQIATTTDSKTASASKTTLVAGGCFWCVESDLEKLPGVLAAVSGYAGGTAQNPTYENYINGGHREVVEVAYDETKVTLEEIVIYAIKHMDPTDGEGSFFDRGEAYAPALYFDTTEEKVLLEKIILDIEKNGPYQKALAIKVLPRPQFWTAEDYHQDYYKGTLSSLKYQYYRKGSGRDAFIAKHWGENTGPTLPWHQTSEEASTVTPNAWQNYIKPDQVALKNTLGALAYEVTQAEGTERSGTSPLDKLYDRGIYVDILSGEPLFSSKDKYDSGTGWPSFSAPISEDAVTEHVDKKLFSTRTEVRSRIADNHLGHVFTDGPQATTGLRYCMNGVALRFVPEAEMETEGYKEWLTSL